MRKCLRERTLVSLLEGEGSSTERAHLEACAACADRYGQLVRDLRVVGQVLREEPPPRPWRSFRSLHTRWIPAIAALALILVSVWGIMRVEKSAAPVPWEETRGEDTSLFADDLSGAIFASGDDSLAEVSYTDADFSYLDSALGEDGNF